MQRVTGKDCEGREKGDDDGHDQDEGIEITKREIAQTERKVCLMV